MMFTVFTPIYNRKTLIHRVFDSLVKQSLRDFEWIVIDDGSTDGVYDLLLEYKSKAMFPVRIIRQENRGKHIAMNRAIDIATGELFIIADSDDSFDPQTLARFKYHWESIPIDLKPFYSGVSCLCKDPLTGTVCGDRFPFSPMDSNTLEMTYLYKFKGEKWGCVRTELYKQMPFPEISGSYIPEGFVYHTLARKYRSLCVNEALRNYYTDCPNALTKPTIISKMNNCKCLYFAMTWELNNNLDYVIKYCSALSILKKSIAIWNMGLCARLGPIKIFNDINPLIAKLIIALSFVPGLLYFKKFEHDHIKAISKIL